MTWARSAHRLLRLALAINLGSRLKFLLLTTLVAIASLVFMGVSELSRASSSDLDEALQADLGAAGSYRVEFSPDLQLDQAGALRHTREALEPLHPTSLQLAVALPAVKPVCPPFEQIGVLSMIVLFDRDNRPVPFDDSEPVDVDADLCLAGLVVPKTALRQASEAEQRLFGAALVLDPTYQRAVQLTSTDPPRLHVVLTTGRSEDMSTAIEQALRDELADTALRAGVPLADAFTKSRLDDGAQVRSASDGIKLVYGLIGWGVLLISGLGLLVAELIVLRDRTWFFGLARAVGARRGDVAMLIMIDIVVVLVAGFGAALGIAFAAGPVVESFGRSAFQTSLQLIRPSVVAPLALGGALMLLLGGVYPAWRATTLDPLEVLERR